MSVRLLLADFDGTLDSLTLLPEADRTRVRFRIRFWDAAEKLVEGVLEFRNVQAFSFTVNCFDNPAGAELFGLYEVQDPAEKASLILENFLARKQEFLLTGYDQPEPEDPHDLLNNTEELEKALWSLERYHLYQQQTQGGTYRLLAESYSLCESRAAQSSESL